MIFHTYILRGTFTFIFFEGNLLHPCCFIELKCFQKIENFLNIASNLFPVLRVIQKIRSEFLRFRG